MTCIRLPYLASAGLLLAIATVTPASAHPEVSGPTGRKCYIATAVDPNPEAGSGDQAGAIAVGPLVTNVPGTLVCTLQVDAVNHSGPDALTRQFASDTNGVIAGTQTAGSPGPPGSSLYLCASFVSDGTTIYYTPRDPNVSDPTGTEYYWTANPDVPCPFLAVQTAWLNGHYG